jgi:hypothetical protein
MSWQHCQTDELAKELADSSANVDGIDLINQCQRRHRLHRISMVCKKNFQLPRVTGLCFLLIPSS